MPVADGGDGLLDAFESAGFEPVPASTPPTRPATSRRRRTRAAATWPSSNWPPSPAWPQLGANLAPLTATSRGVGEVIAAALDAGCTRGRARHRRQRLDRRRRRAWCRRWARGCSTPPAHDVGAGGLGAQAAATLDLRRPAPARSPSATVEVACDVDNPLTGPHGAAAVYGAAEGRRPEQVAALDAALAPLGRPRRRTRPARPARRSPAPGRPAASASRRAPSSAPRCVPASSWCSTSMRLRRAVAAAPTSSSPARARWTSRRCTARRRPASRPPPARRRPGGRGRRPVPPRRGHAAGAGFDAVYTLARRGGRTGRGVHRPGAAAAPHRRAHRGRGSTMSGQRHVSALCRAPVVGGVERPAATACPRARVAVTRRPDRRRRAVSTPTARRARAVELGRRRGAAARPGRHARARQRARPHRVGGLRHRDPRRRGRRRHHDRRHAAEQHPADDDARRAATPSRTRGARRPTSTSGSGAARCPATSPTSPRCTTPASSASSAS